MNHVLVDLAGHMRFTLVTDIQVYFCDPQNPFKRKPTFQ